jgi:lipopolysaccharide export system protein LptA
MFRVALLITILLGGLPAYGQGIAFGPFRQDPEEPVEVTSERLEVDQNGGVATFIGDVIVVQGQMRLTAPRVRVEYTTGDEGKIQLIHATGGVTMVNGEETAEGEDAVYSVDAGTVVMSGDVIVTQGPNVLAGQQLFVDLDTGTGTMEGRVRTIFKQENQ